MGFKLWLNKQDEEGTKEQKCEGVNYVSELCTLQQNWQERLLFDVSNKKE